MLFNEAQRLSANGQAAEALAAYSAVDRALAGQDADARPEIVIPEAMSTEQICASDLVA